MKNQSISVRSSLAVCFRRCSLVLLFVALALWSRPARAAADPKEAGVRLLKAQLPTGKGIQEIDCEVLSRAVNRATIAHRVDAPAILSAALMNGSTDDPLPKEAKRSCECVGRIVRAAVKGAPTKASELLDVAVALYPDCADALAAILKEAKSDIAYTDYKDRTGLVDAPVAGINNLGTAGDPGLNGFGAGFGPGTPGSPGFGGSNPGSGAFALPTPAGAAVTSAVNQ